MFYKTQQVLCNKKWYMINEYQRQTWSCNLNFLKLYFHTKILGFFVTE